MPVGCNRDETPEQRRERMRNVVAARWRKTKGRKKRAAIMRAVVNARWSRHKEQLQSQTTQLPPPGQSVSTDSVGEATL